MHGTNGVDFMYPAASASLTVGYFVATSRASVICPSSASRSPFVSVCCCTMPRSPCSLAATSAFDASDCDPPSPPPTWPGDDGVGAAFSHADVPFALPGMILIAFVPTTTGVTLVVGVVDDAVFGFALALLLEPEQPESTRATTA